MICDKKLVEDIIGLAFWDLFSPALLDRLLSAGVTLLVVEH
jgi:hypothetical protein